MSDRQLTEAEVETIRDSLAMLRLQVDGVNTIGCKLLDRLAVSLDEPPNQSGPGEARPGVMGNILDLIEKIRLTVNLTRRIVECIGEECERL